MGAQGRGKPSLSQVLAGPAAPRQGCDAAPEPVPGGGGSLPLSRACRSPRPGPAEGGCSLRGGSAVLHLGPAGLNLEPSRLFLRRCSSRWHCAGGNLGEVSEGLGRGTLSRIRALHPAAWAASAPKSPSFPRFPCRALAERFTFKCPLGVPRRSCHSRASPPKTEGARGRRGNEKVQRFNAFLSVCSRQAGRSPSAPPGSLPATCPVWWNSRVPLPPPPAARSPPASIQLSSPGALFCIARSAGMGGWKLACT